MNVNTTTDSLYQERYDELSSFLAATDRYDEHDIPGITHGTLEEMTYYERNPMTVNAANEAMPAWEFVLRHLITPEMRIVTGQYAQPAIDLAISLAWVSFGKTPLDAFLRQERLSPADFVVDVWTSIQRVRGELLVEGSA